MIASQRPYENGYGKNVKLTEKKANFSCPDCDGAVTRGCACVGRCDRCDKEIVELEEVSE